MALAPEDLASEVRPGEELDPNALEQFFSTRLPGFQGPITIKQFRKGHSNLTYLISTPTTDYVLRRPPFGATEIKAGHDMLREQKVLTTLSGSYSKIPKVYLAASAEDSPFGASFFLMERVRGVILRATPPDGIELNAPVMKRVSEMTVDALVELHQINVQSGNLASLGKPQGYVQRQVKGWVERYRAAKTDEIDSMEQAARWLEEQIPAEDPSPCVVHNDFKYDNMVLSPELDSIRAVLDWEMATVGDRRTDLGTTLAYWITENDPDELKALPVGLTSLPGNLSRTGVIERYQSAIGRELPNMHYFYIFSLFKVATIAQQIYMRFAKGYTKDPRFGALLFAVHAVGAGALRSIQTSKIE